MFEKIINSEIYLKCASKGCDNKAEYILYIQKIINDIPTPYCEKCKQYFDRNMPEDLKSKLNTHK